jgi:cold shock CspA family protein
MRSHGTLISWNDDRGFGFIESAGREKIFVHISAFPRDGVRPRLGELVSFELDVRGDGKPQAVGVMRAGGRTSPVRVRHPRRAPGRNRLFGRTALLLVLVVAGWYGYRRLVADRVPLPASAPYADRAIAMPPTPSFSCDGRTRCPQMKSCAEATFFIKQCPGTQMDGDGDGVPCERQWCPGE